MWDCSIAMNKTACGLVLGVLMSGWGVETAMADWKDVLTGPFRGVQYSGARRYVRPIAPQTAPAQPPPAGVVSPTPPPVPGAAAAPAAPAAPTAAADKKKAEAAAVLKRTIEFQTKRAEQGSVTAQYDLGKRYLTGDGLEKSLPQARKWFEAAAKQGHVGAAAKLEEVKKLEAATPAPTRPAAPKNPTEPAAAPAPQAAPAQ